MFRTKGYHGTSQEIAKKIETGESFESSDSRSWLGKGVYFYEDFSLLGRDVKGKQEARKWVVHVKKISKFSILEAELSCPEEDFLDLASDEEDKKNFYILRQEVLNGLLSSKVNTALKSTFEECKLGKHSLSRSEDRSLALDLGALAIMIDVLKRRKGKEPFLIRALTQSASSKKIGNVILDPHVEVCVRELSVITRVIGVKR